MFCWSTVFSLLRGLVALLPHLLELDGAVRLELGLEEDPVQRVVDQGVAVDDLAADGGDEDDVADVLLVGHLDLVGQLGAALVDALDQAVAVDHELGRRRP